MKYARSNEKSGSFSFVEDGFESLDPNPFDTQRDQEFEENNSEFRFEIFLMYKTRVGRRDN